MTLRSSVAIAAAGTFLLALSAAGTAQAGDKRHKHWRGGHHHHHYHHVPPGHVRYYYPAPVYVAPAPVYYAPAPVYAVPSRPVVSFGAVIPLR
jgi:hypothetical protein